ncbi:type I-E CRISPR-associated protein Cse1/CasA [Maritimibacter sp. 55A14]|uniref:type I-E CRISPR-associated protein Cse1/CasA n=1 Tax=Maritimibacter sp. 55A14 TaxID=2174844 RepID=UPI001304D8AC|nr:type I-E CRISPR-associated protein Cse1/CasA [Maritimibacter sp. 55A14]
MTLNLISDPWIPVVDRSGHRRVIAPWQMADEAILGPDWPRADLNIACYELLIGLVHMADPPEDIDDWENREAPDPDRLRAKLTAYENAFNLTGDGPLFLQDLEPLEGAPNPPDMLFIDSAGANTAKNNADLVVHRGRYRGLDLPLAAMALFTFQAHAPSGGKGNRTSMRGGGPMVTLVDPQDGLWSLVWANVPYGVSASLTELPWMNPTRVSDNKQEAHPPQGQTFSVEAFFGAPRRLRLVAEHDVVTGVIQKPYGANYASWVHPLSPYYRQKAGDVALPVHPRAGTFGYRHWLGILTQPHDAELAQRAACLDTWENGRSGQRPAHVIVAGWAMDNMKPRDFVYSVQPFIELSEDSRLVLSGLVDAADNAAVALRNALTPILARGEAREAEREAFYIATEPAFLARLEALKSDVDPSKVCAGWRDDLKSEALRRFDALALPALAQRHSTDIQKIVTARRNLTGTCAGYGKYGKQLYQALGLDLPSTKGKAA